jgi:hypothetical protein
LFLFLKKSYFGTVLVFSKKYFLDNKKEKEERKLKTEEKKSYYVLLGLIRAAHAGAASAAPRWQTLYSARGRALTGSARERRDMGRAHQRVPAFSSVRFLFSFEFCSDSIFVQNTKFVQI